MNTPTARALHEEADKAIFEILRDGSAEASFQGRQYTNLDLIKLRELSNYYRCLAIQRGEISPGPNEGPVNVSQAEFACE